MTDRTFGQIMSLLAEHGKLGELQTTVIDDGFIAAVCDRLAESPIPDVSPDEVRRAWAVQRSQLPDQPS